MILLSLLRHAKTAPGSAMLDDYERPLTAAGRQALLRIAPALEDAVPDAVLCSTALRTRQTLDQIRPALAASEGAGPAAIYLEPGLYLADASALLDRLRRLGPEVRHALLIGHNPGLHELAVELLMPDQRAQLSAGFPTASLARLQVAGWPDLAAGSARLVLWRTPADGTSRG